MGVFTTDPPPRARNSCRAPRASHASRRQVWPCTPPPALRYSPPMKIFVSSDIEGTAGIADWQQVLGPGAEYERGRRLLLDEVNAAIDGALAGGAQEIVVNDSHAFMFNLPAEELHGGASSILGKHKPLYMMQGLDGSFDAVFLIAYHGSIGHERAILSHTYNPTAIGEVRL